MIFFVINAVQLLNTSSEQKIKAVRQPKETVTIVHLISNSQKMLVR